MSKNAFVDTTVLANVLLKPSKEGKIGLAALKSYERASTPTYALKELQLGPLRGYVWLHNALLANSMADVYDRIGALSRGFQKNLLSTAIEGLREAAKADRVAPGARITDRNKEQAYIYRLATKGLIMRAWAKRRRVAEVMFPLGCYEEEPPTEDHRGVLSRGVACPQAAKCELATELRKRIDLVAQVRDAVTSLKSSRREDQKRAQALNKFLKRPQAGISPEQCRALGDAVFAVLCPEDAEILTTNLRDHAPLAAALGKKAVAPDA